MTIPVFHSALKGHAAANPYFLETNPIDKGFTDGRIDGESNRLMERAKIAA